MGLFPTEFYYFLISGAVLMGLVVGVINFLLGGFLTTFMKVKASRGRKLLVRVRHPVMDYFKVGAIEEGFLVYKVNKEDTKRLSMEEGVVSRALGVYWVEVDAIKNCFYKPDGSAVSGWDAIKFDELLKRALYRPLTLGDQLLKILILLVIGAIIAVAIVGFFAYKGYKMDQQILSILQAGATAAQAAAGTGVVA